MDRSVLEMFVQMRALNMDDYSGSVTGRLYVVLNLERMTDNRPVFWRAEGRGYTRNIMLAGIYDEDAVGSEMIGADDPVVPIHKLPELLRCDMETLKQFIK